MVVNVATQITEDAERLLVEKGNMLPLVQTTIEANWPFLQQRLIGLSAYCVGVPGGLIGIVVITVLPKTSDEWSASAMTKYEFCCKDNPIYTSPPEHAKPFLEQLNKMR